MRSRIRELKEIERILFFLQGEIRYKYSVLSEAFGNISEKFGQPFSNWLAGLSRVLDTKSDNGVDSVGFVDTHENEYETVDKIWHLSMVMLREGTSLKEKDLNNLDQVGKCLGYLDVEAQILGIDMERENMKQTIAELEKGVEQKNKLSVVLGLLGGILVALLMF